MTGNPEETAGVGIDAERQPAVQTELLDYLAKEGLRNILLITSRMRAIAGEHPVEYPDLPARVFSLQQLAAHLEAGLQEAGYEQDDINRLSASKIKPVSHDPLKPRSNL